MKNLPLSIVLFVDNGVECFSIKLEQHAPLLDPYCCCPRSIIKHSHLPKHLSLFNKLDKTFFWSDWFKALELSRVNYIYLVSCLTLLHDFLPRKIHPFLHRIYQAPNVVVIEVLEKKKLFEPKKNPRVDSWLFSARRNLYFLPLMMPAIDFAANSFPLVVPLRLELSVLEPLVV